MNSPEDEPNNPPPAVGAAGAVEDPPNENPPPPPAASVGPAAAVEGAPLPVAVDPLNGGGFTAGVVDVNGGVEGAVPNEKTELLVAGAGVVGALAGVDLPNTAVVLLPHVTMIDVLCLLNI